MHQYIVETTIITFWSSTYFILKKNNSPQSQPFTALNVQGSDTTGDAGSGEAGSKKRFTGYGMV